jgi:hypothetical protein
MKVPSHGTPPEHLLSAKKAADYVGISLKRLYQFCHDGSLRHLRLADTNAGVLRFRGVWLDAWAESRATGGIGPRSLGPCRLDRSKCQCRWVR